MIEIDDHCDVMISGNYVTADDDDTQHYDNGRHACSVSLKRSPQAVLGRVRRGAAIFGPMNRYEGALAGGSYGSRGWQLRLGPG